MRRVLVALFVMASLLAMTAVTALAEVRTAGPVDI